MEVKSLSVMLIFAIRMLVTEHLQWLLMSASLLEAHSHCMCQSFVHTKKNIVIAHTLL